MVCFLQLFFGLDTNETSTGVPIWSWPPRSTWFAFGWGLSDHLRWSAVWSLQITGFTRDWANTGSALPAGGRQQQLRDATEIPKARSALLGHLGWREVRSLTDLLFQNRFCKFTKAKHFWKWCAQNNESVATNCWSIEPFRNDLFSFACGGPTQLELEASVWVLPWALQKNPLV